MKDGLTQRSIFRVNKATEVKWTVVTRTLIIDRVYRPSPDFWPNSMFLATLLLQGGIETNPGPAAVNNCVRIEFTESPIGCRKAPLIRDVVSNHLLDILVNIETWFSMDMPPATSTTDRIAWLLHPTSHA